MATTNDVDASKILGKGPEYLRKQLELEHEANARVSAVERLAATKPKYVKSQQVDNSTKVLIKNIESVSVNSNGSSNQGSKVNCNIVTVTNPLVGKSEAQRGVTQADNVVRRTSSKKRDSLLLYRQKCDLLKVSTNEKSKKYLARKLLLGSFDKNISLPEATNRDCTQEDNDCKILSAEGNSRLSWTNEKSETKLVIDHCEKPCNKRVTDVQRKSRNSVSRSHSDISSRYSKNFADFDAFFKYCGLDSEVIDSLGKENLSNERTNIRKISNSSSEDGFSRNSGDSDGLLEEELQETIRQGVSVIERNARVIQWLYSCKNATETGKKIT